MPVKGTYLALAGGGAILLWSGIKGKQWSDVLRQLIAGKPPQAATTAYVIQGTPQSAFAYGTGVGTGGGGPVPTTGGPKGSVFTQAKIGALWVMAGGNPAKTKVAICIAMHESSGRTQVTSPNPDGGTNVGLWQLDTRGKGAGFTIAQLQNPLTNARVAVRGSSNGTDWSAWSTAGSCGV